MPEREESTGDGATAQGRAAVAASIIGGLLIGGYFASSSGEGTGPRPVYLVNAVVLIPAFWFPSQRIAAARDVLRQWRPLVVWLLSWTLVWDLASSGVTGGARELFQEWWLVYPAGVLTLGALLALHGWIVGHLAHDTPGDAARSDGP